MAKSKSQFVNLNGVKIRKNKTAAQLAEQMNRIFQPVAHAGYRENEDGDYEWSNQNFYQDWTPRHKRIADMAGNILESDKGIITDTDDHYNGPEYKGHELESFAVADPKNANATIGKLAGTGG